MGSFLVFLFFVVFTTATTDFDSEFSQLKDAVYKKMEFYAPWIMTEKKPNVAYFFCPQGFPGHEGIMGEKGLTTLNGEIDTSEFLLQNQISAYECDIESAANEVLRRLQKDIPYQKDLPMGMLGLMGYTGRSSGEQLKHWIRTKCYTRYTNSTEACLTTLDVYYYFKQQSETRPIECPSDLIGGIGKQGPIGISGDLPITETYFDQKLDEICPFLLE